MNKPNLTSIEKALDDGRIWAAMKNGRYWHIRRNGKTKLWKTIPNQFRIPIKAGLKSYGELTDDSNIAFDVDGCRSADFVIGASHTFDPNNHK